MRIVTVLASALIAGGSNDGQLLLLQHVACAAAFAIDLALGDLQEGGRRMAEEIGLRMWTLDRSSG